MGVALDLKNDLPVAMTMAAFMGVAWYICVELNIRLFLTFLRKRGLYFWSCCVGSWGVLTQPLFMIMADFELITNSYLAFTLIYISWWLMVVPQSVVLYSRLHLVVSNPQHHKYVLYMIIFTTIFISFPTMGLGVAAQASQIPRLVSSNLIWDRIQVSIFFVQETIISVFYIIETRGVLRNRTTLGADDKTVRTVMHHLIYTNLLVVFFDISLLGMSYSHFFYVQAAYKPCVYGVKLRIEFSILNRLVQSLRGSSTRSYGDGTENYAGRKPATGRAEYNATNRNNMRLATYTPQSEISIVPPIVHRHSTLSVQRHSTPSIEEGSYARDEAEPTSRLSVVPDKPQMLSRPGGGSKDG